MENEDSPVGWISDTQSSDQPIAGWNGHGKHRNLARENPSTDAMCKSFWVQVYLKMETPAIKLIKILMVRIWKKCTPAILMDTGTQKDCNLFFGYWYGKKKTAIWLIKSRVCHNDGGSFLGHNHRGPISYTPWLYEWRSTQQWYLYCYSIQIPFKPSCLMIKSH